MNNSTTPVEFKFTEKSVRVEMDENNNPLFHANDVCGILGYANPRDAIAKHCRAGGVAKRDTPTESAVQSMTYIDEGNLYRLIIKSRKPEAERFESWVCDEVLPTIRKTGSYTNPNHQEPAPQESVEKITRQQLDQINRLVHGIMTCCHNQGAANHAAYAGIRSQYGIHTVDDLPSIHFNTVYGMLNVIHEKAQQYLKLRSAIDKKFIGDVVKNHQFQLEITQQMLLPTV
jgi:prophage antirepressor-like protein